MSGSPRQASVASSSWPGRQGSPSLRCTTRIRRYPDSSLACCQWPGRRSSTTRTSTTARSASPPSCVLATTCSALSARNRLIGMLAPTSSAPVRIDAGRASEVYHQLLAKFHEQGDDPMTVDFRSLFPEVASTERATHNLHPYPAKMLRHIPSFSLAVPELAGPGARVLDPFCGSGTTLVEALVAGNPAVGLDVNPLATLLAKVKSTPVSPRRAHAALASVVAMARQLRRPRVPNRDRLRYWFHPRVLTDLARLRIAVEDVGDPDVRDLLKASLSLLARQVSLADPRVSVPVRLRPERYPEDHRLRAAMSRRLAQLGRLDVLLDFERATRETIARIGRLEGLRAEPIVVYCADARGRAAADAPVEPATIDLIVTSPPYLGAQKYIRASSLNLFALDLVDAEGAGELLGRSVGREFFRRDEYAEAQTTGIHEADALIEESRCTNPLRAHLATTYLREMRSAFAGIATRLKPGGAFVLVAGDNQLCDVPFPTSRFLEALAHERGLRTELRVVDAIRSRGLMTRRNHSSASPIAHEHVVVFRR